jgi:PTH1 family peptidyl-tRNA hydrolase|tara:strand:- start:831 stop:1448 length:618 start_codon:yes stop_codon:yes gene_type:complete
MSSAHLIVGLGNPGSKYKGTRHNVGFMAVEKLADLWAVSWSEEKKFKARMSRAVLGEKTIHLCEPLTYMNLSGETVRAVLDYCRIETAKMLIVVDDANIDLGEVRLRIDGGTGGHNGLGSVEQHLATLEFSRLRIGVGRPAEVRQELSSHVLGLFAADEMVILDRVLSRVVQQVECWLQHGAEQAMNKFNGKLEFPDEDKDNITT